MAPKKSSPRKFVVVRTYSAGVHTGELIEKRDTANGRLIVVLANSRRLWRWNGANSLNEVALRGVSESYSRISEPVAETEIPDVIECLTATPEAQANLERSRWSA